MPPNGSADLENCPVPDDMLKRLLDSTRSAVSEVGADLPEAQRAELAVYCYRRAHFRDIGLSLAGLCSRQALVMEAGHAGAQIYSLANAKSERGDEISKRARGEKAPVSLHVV